MSIGVERVNSVVPPTERYRRFLFPSPPVFFLFVAPDVESVIVDRSRRERELS